MSRTALLRDPIKYVRDKAKARYNKGSHCEICDSTENLDFHHYYTMTPLFNKWCKDKKYTVKVVDDILSIRDEFISDEEDKIYNQTVTLCHEHHMKLHSVYGKDPALFTANKQMNWVKIQREKHEARKLAS
ncbi:MAG: hypothetical protein ACO387_03465 [Flavobacteriaceae bacterium]